jgi:hypothetical protein
MRREMESAIAIREYEWSKEQWWVSKWIENCNYSKSYKKITRTTMNWEMQCEGRIL